MKYVVTVLDQSIRLSGDQTTPAVKKLEATFEGPDAEQTAKVVFDMMQAWYAHVDHDFTFDMVQPRTTRLGQRLTPYSTAS